MGAGTDSKQLLMSDGWRARLHQVLDDREIARVSLSDSDKGDDTGISGGLDISPSALILTLGVRWLPIFREADSVDESTKEIMRKLIK